LSTSSSSSSISSSSQSSQSAPGSLPATEAPPHTGGGQAGGAGTGLGPYYIFYEQVAVSNTVLSRANFNIPNQVTHVELQADTANIRYTMDGYTDPTVSSGMLLLTTSDPKIFMADDLLKLRVIRDGGSDANLNMHYVGTVIPQITLP
jgi:hypothetical protein